MAGRFAGDALEHTVEVSDTVEPAVVGDRGDAVIIPIGQALAGLIDTHFIQEGDEGMHRMFFEIAAEGLGCHMSLLCCIFQRDGLIVLLHDKIVDGADTNTFMFAVGRRRGAG